MEAETEQAEPRAGNEEAESAVAAPAASGGAAPRAAPDSPPPGARPAVVAASERAPRTAFTPQIDDLFAAVRRLEAFAADEAKRVSGKLVPKVEDQAKKNIWVSLLLALGLGLILGIWLTGGRRRD